jgi:hypothetical protein
MPNTVLPDFRIEAKGTLSESCLTNNLYHFSELCTFIRALPYKRNPNKLDLSTVFTDACGTCSTKHALLKQVADENLQTGISLRLGIFKMHAKNTKKVKHVLERYGIDYIPEAHNYLRYQGNIHDFTGKGFNPSNYMDDILDEIEITPSQITHFKVAHHQKFIQQWLAENTQILLSERELWQVREACIEALAQN